MNSGIAPLAGLQVSDPAGAAGGVRSPATPVTVAETTVAPAPLHPHPSFHIDAALGLVVMEFRDGPGLASSTIPTAQQLEAYRRAAGTRHAAGADTGASPANSAGPSGTIAASTNAGSTNAGNTNTAGAGSTPSRAGTIAFAAPLLSGAAPS